MNRIPAALFATGVLALSASAASAQSLRGTASTFWTTAPGVSNNSATPQCDNCGVFVDAEAYQGSASAMASVPLTKQQEPKSPSKKSVSGNASAR